MPLKKLKNALVALVIFSLTFGQISAPVFVFAQEATDEAQIMVEEIQPTVEEATPEASPLAETILDVTSAPSPETTLGVSTQTPSSPPSPEPLVIPVSSPFPVPVIIETVDLEEPTLNAKITQENSLVSLFNLILSTNKGDYHPGEYVTVSGSGFLPGETVSLTFNETPYQHPDNVIFTTANSSGEIYNQDFLINENDLGATFTLVATGLTSGISITTIFTDSALVTSASNGTGISVNKAVGGSSAGFTTLGNIILTEGSNTDFADTASASKTLILLAPNGWQFNTGVGTVSASSGKDIKTSPAGSAPAISVTSSTITVTFIVSGVTKTDVLTISGIQVQATSASSSAGNIYRPGTGGGSATIAGITTTANTDGSGGTNFGSLSQSANASAANSTVVASSTSIPADGTTTSTLTVTVKDGSSNLLSGKTITLTSSRGAIDTVSAASGASDVNGQVTFTVKSSTAGTSVYTATDTTDSITITQTATVSYTSGSVNVTTATGGTAVDASTNSSTGSGNWTVISGPTVAEVTTASITTGTFVLNAPTGFSFNTSSLVTSTITRIAGSKSCFAFSSNTATPSLTSITFTVTSIDGSGGSPTTTCQVVFSNIQIRPTSGWALASGNITNSGTSTGFPGGLTSYGTLTEVDTTGPTTPIASPSAGNYSSSQVVTLTSNDTGSGLNNIYYTTDGTTPSSSNGTLYTTAVTVSSDLTLKAIAYDMAGNSSSVLSAVYGIISVASSIGGVSSGGYSAPACTDSAPSSAPTLLSAIASGSNEVTLTWSKASDPVSYYLVTYGYVSGQQSFGNPNVGDKNTTSYTIKGLSGGQTYFFKVRAGNGCTPGSFSNELSVTPAGAVINSPASGFSEGVLGVESDTVSEDLGINADVLGETATPLSDQMVTKDKGAFSFITDFFNAIFSFIKNLF